MDANESWSESGMAAVMMRRLAEYDIEFFEQPLLYYDYEGAARLRRSTGLPVAANQTDLPRRREQGFSANCLRLKNLPSDNG